MVLLFLGFLKNLFYAALQIKENLSIANRYHASLVEVGLMDKVKTNQEINGVVHSMLTWSLVRWL